MSFHNVLFPSCLEMFLNGKSLFSTSKVISSSGREVRSLDCEYNKGQYLLKDCLLSESEFEIFNNFFKARRGSRFSFLLKDFADSAVSKQSIGVGDGNRREFQLYKAYHDEKYPYIRKITRVRENSLKIFFEGREISDWQLKDKGIIALQHPPEEGLNLLASFEFYIVVRFSEDSFDYKLRADGTIEILNVSLVEVME